MNNTNNTREIWFIYDGECPLCSNAALALRIKQEYGVLQLVNARTETQHHIIKKINSLNYDLDEGMVIYDGEQFYHGKAALRFMAKYSKPQGIFNLSNKLLYWSDTIASIIYPWLRGVRNLLIRRRNVGRIDNLELKTTPTFQSIFGDDWDNLPIVMRKHYKNRPYTNDITTVTGTLDVMCAGPIKLFAPLFWLLGGIPPHNEKNVPVTVHFQSDKNTKAFHFNREFNFATRAPYRFQSRMLQTKDNEVIELMRFGLGWKMNYHWQDQQVQLRHKGYVFHLFGHFIPLPLTFLLGEGNADEVAIDDNTFAMNVTITHPWWGIIYQYKGQFEVQETS